MQITVKAAELIRGLNAVLPHSSADGTRANTFGVRLQVIDQLLYLVATDGHTMGIYRLPLVEPKDQHKHPGRANDNGFYTFLDLPDAKQLLALAKMGQAAFKTLPTDVHIDV